MPEVYRFIIDRVNNIQGSMVLDIGCGDGSLLEQIHGKTLHGVDICEEQLSISSKKGINVHLTNLNCDQLPYADQFFDIVISSEVIEHVLVPDILLQETYRVLKQDGTFILTTPNLASLGKRLLLLINRNPFIECSPLEIGAVGHLRYFILPTLKDIVEKHGFTIQHYTSDVVNFDGLGCFRSTHLAHIYPTLGRTLMLVLKKMI